MGHRRYGHHPRRTARAHRLIRNDTAHAREDPTMPTEPHTPPEATSERLAMALAAIKAPASMIAAARAGHYDDYKSELAAPIVQLVADLGRLDTPEATELAHRAMGGEFDGTRAEAEEWARSPEGRETFGAFGLKPGFGGSQ